MPSEIAIAEKILIVVPSAVASLRSHLKSSTQRPVILSAASGRRSFESELGSRFIDLLEIVLRKLDIHCAKIFVQSM